MGLEDKVNEFFEDSVFDFGLVNEDVSGKSVSVSFFNDGDYDGVSLGLGNREKDLMHGLSFSVISGFSDVLVGGQFNGLVGYVNEKFFGGQFSGLYNYSSKCFGVQYSGFMNEADDGICLQVGSYNKSYNPGFAIQLGLVNSTVEGNYLKLGVLNFSEDSYSFGIDYKDDGDYSIED